MASSASFRACKIVVESLAPGAPPDGTRKSARSSPVVVLAASTPRSREALVRADELAGRLGAPLYVAVCVPGAASTDAAPLSQREIAAGMRLWRWCNRILLETVPLEHVLVGRGDLVTLAIHAARALDAQLLVVPEADVEGARDVTTIVEEAGVSVLLARATRPNRAVVAATDLTLETFPVLAEASAVAGVLGARVTFVHNVAPTAEAPVVVTGEGFVCLPMQVDAELLEARSRRLETAAGAIAAGAGVTLCAEADTVGAILDLARQQEADLVVVGHKRRTWLGRIFGDRVAAGVVGRALRSVLVVPIVTPARRRSRGAS